MLLSAFVFGGFRRKFEDEFFYFLEVQNEKSGEKPQKGAESISLQGVASSESYAWGSPVLMELRLVVKRPRHISKAFKRFSHPTPVYLPASSSHFVHIFHLTELVRDTSAGVRYRSRYLSMETPTQ